MILKDLKISLAVSTYRQKGNLAYEYHPFRNYLILENTEVIGGFYIPEGKAINKTTGKVLNKLEKEKIIDGETIKYTYWVDEDNIIIPDENVLVYDEYTSKGEIIEANSLVDLDTDLLNFDINHPVEIEVLPSYDGSVNLILNDNKNTTRLINSRFSVREKNTYEIVDRIGENDTNIYTLNGFEKDTSLYFLCRQNPIIKFDSLISGRLNVGLYCFYITYCDADENESDFVAESRPIPVYNGNDKFSIDGGIKNQLTDKGIRLKITNLESSYNYIKIYYVRYLADYNLHRTTECKKLFKKISIQNKQELTIDITNYDNTEDLDPNYINSSKFNVKAVLTLAQCKNMLFFGNLKENIDNYKELTDCALKIFPVLNKVNLQEKTGNYSDKVNFYEDTEILYNYTGYFGEEYYRFGVVFIYNNGQLSNVYNTLGAVCGDFSTLSSFKEDSIIYKTEDNVLVRNYINSDSDGWIKNAEEFFELNNTNLDLYLNSKGVCKISGFYTSKCRTLGITFKVSKKVIKYLKEELNIRGLFFVRQKRIPELIAQCMILPMDSELEGPVIKYKLDNGADKYTCESFISQNKNDKYAVGDKMDINGINSSSSQYSSGTFGGESTLQLNKAPGFLMLNYDRRLVNYNRSTVATYEGSSPQISRLEAISKNAYAGICPDFLLNLPYYNQIFNGSSFYVRRVTDSYLSKAKDYSGMTLESNSFGGQGSGTTGETSDVSSNSEKISQLAKYGRIYATDNDNFNYNYVNAEVKICSVTEDVKVVALEDLVYRLNIGEAEEAIKFRKAGESMDLVNYFKDDSLVRGIYSPYLAIYCDERYGLVPGCIYNIYKKDVNLDNISLKIKERMNIYEPYYAISDRLDFSTFTGNSIKGGTEKIIKIDCFGGDCYLNQFTYRLNRNFNDPSLPNNDMIIRITTWYENIIQKSKDSPGYVKAEDLKNLSRADVNAIQLGSWILFYMLSSFNYIFRSEDHSYVSEKALMGSPRTYYPKVAKPWLGNFKMLDSYLYNDAFRATLGVKEYFNLEDTNYLKNTFSNRILYSSIAILDSFKNNYRESRSTYYRDYSLEYGSITRLIGFEGYILVVFEHAIGIAVVNERVLAGQGDGNPVFINTQNVLPEELTIVSDTYGSLWGESIIKSEAGYVYGVDTVSKKIWRVKGLLLEILSDVKVDEFLINNISLNELELYPIVSIKNVKTHYNNNKKDIMFTFYDDYYKDEEKLWNLCFNELMDKFITFYSWIPSYSENIGTEFFSFDRKSSRNIALLYKNNYNIPTNYGIVIDSPIIEDGKNFAYIYYRQINLDIYTIRNIDGSTTLLKKLKNNPIYYYDGVKFILEKDHWGNSEKVDIVYESEYDSGLDKTIVRAKLVLKKSAEQFRDIIYLLIRPLIENENNTIYFKPQTIALAFKSKLTNKTDDGKFTNNYFKTDFYLHGNSGIIDVLDQILPCFWYEEQHPFEFEFVVNDKIGQNKIFSNLIIISNKAEPESFHFEIEGDGYEFSKDKRAMYYRLEETKELYLNLGSDILFDRDYKEITWHMNTKELYYRSKDNTYINNYNKLDRVYPVESLGLVQLVKSTIFPLYYNRIDSYDDIYHNYSEMNGENIYDFKNLSGSEIKWNKKLNLFNIVTHIKNSPINLVGRIRGNSQYKDGKWFIQIPSINYMLKNEPEWPPSDLGYVPPIVISRVPDDIKTQTIKKETLPNTIKTNNINDYVQSTNGWTLRKETRIRDKWIKIRVRYSGKNLAIIHSITTLYNNI